MLSLHIYSIRFLTFCFTARHGVMIQAPLCWLEKSCFVADGICVQSIEHPGCVWDAKFLENGDIVTACSDGIVRIWTIDHERTADAVELDSFASLISQYKLSRYSIR